MTDPIQQQLIAARKNQILDAAAAIFAEKGYHLATTKDVAKRAGIAEGTIYNYFENKTALLLGIFDRMKASIIQQNLPPAPHELDLRGLLRVFLTQSLMALQGDHFALFRIILSEMMVNEDLRALYYQQILEPTLMLAEPLFAQHLAAHGHPPETAPLVLRAISGMVLGLILEAIMGDAIVTRQWDTLPDRLTELILKGLSIPHDTT